MALGIGPLCSEGWLHCYSDPLLAVLISPAHVSFKHPRLFEGEAEGATLDDRGLKLGVEKLTLTKEIEQPEVTIEQRVKFAILCALEVSNDSAFREWAENWLIGKNRESAAGWAWEQLAEASAAEWTAERTAAEWEAERAAERAAVAAAAVARAVVVAAEAAARTVEAARAAAEVRGKFLDLVDLAKGVIE